MSLTHDEIIVISQLKELVKILDDNKIHFWLHAGTILGYIRSDKKHLLTKDLDIDLLIWEDSFEGLLNIVPAIQKEFKVKVCKDKIVVTRGVFDASIGCYRPEGNLAVRYTIAIKNRFGSLLYRIIMKLKNRTLIHILLKIGHITKAIHPSKKMIGLRLFKNLKKENLFGVEINIPSDTIGYLEFKYGPRWKTPVDAKNWEHSTVTAHYQKPKTFKNLRW